MRPANIHQAKAQMTHLLGRKLTGNRKTRVREHTRRGQQISDAIWRRFQVGPYQYRLKHLRWYLDIQTKELKPATRYRHWLTVQNIVQTLNKDADWFNSLKGPWMEWR